MSRSPSPLLLWWEVEKTKQRSGLENEIDFNEITQALKGVKNKWHEKVKANQKIFENYVNGKTVTWQEIKKL